MDNVINTLAFQNYFLLAYYKIKAQSSKNCLLVISFPNIELSAFTTFYTLSCCCRTAVYMRWISFVQYIQDLKMKVASVSIENLCCYVRFLFKPHLSNSLCPKHNTQRKLYLCNPVCLNTKK